MNIDAAVFVSRYPSPGVLHLSPFVLLIFNTRMNVNVLTAVALFTGARHSVLSRSVISQVEHGQAQDKSKVKSKGLRRQRRKKKKKEFDGIKSMAGGVSVVVGGHMSLAGFFFN